MNEYYPNNWQEYKDADEEMFVRHSFDELMTWKLANWELPSSVCCIIRIENTRTGKIKEHVYQRHAAADRKIAKLMQDPDVSFVVCDHANIHYFSHVNPFANQDEPEDEGSQT